MLSVPARAKASVNDVRQQKGYNLLIGPRILPIHLMLAGDSLWP